jgi:CDP-diacylglycerol--glycerol-3-phosphate 3-phosphatidyltransferase
VLDARAREALKGLSDWIGRALTRAHFTADRVTALAILVVAGGAWRIAAGGLRSGGIILTFGGLLDFCDGSVARVQGTSSRRGAFLDSVTDRVSDSLVFSALLWYFLVRKPDLWTAGVVLSAYALAVLTSYIRAKAESLGYDCKVGLLERAERLIVLNVGLILTWILVPLLWVLAALSAVTVVQRLVHVSKQARAEKT